MNNSANLIEALANQDGPECPHIPFSIQVSRMRKHLQGRKDLSCQSCSALADEEKVLNPILWRCLYCGHVLCSKSENLTKDSHMYIHCTTKAPSKHNILINTTTFKFWCIGCNANLNPQVIKYEQLQEIQTDVRSWKERRDSREKEINGGTPVVNTTQTTAAKKSNKIKYPGLINLGNTCFFNSTIQCLAYTPPIRRLTEDPHNFDKFGPLAYSFMRFVEQIHTSGSGSLSPKVLFSKICGKWNMYSNFQQQDSHELLRRLLDDISEEEKSVFRTKLKMHQETTYAPLPTRHKNTFIESIFMGKLVSVVICSECGHTSFAYEDLLDFSLPIPVTKTKKINLNFFGKNSKPDHHVEDGSSIKDGSSVTSSSEVNSISSGHSIEASKSGQTDSAALFDLKPQTPTIVVINQPWISGMKKDWINELFTNVDVKNDSVLTIDKSLRKFMSVEVLEGENAWACELCWRKANPKTPNTKKHTGSTSKILSEVDGTPINSTLDPLKRNEKVEESTEIKITRAFSSEDIKSPNLLLNISPQSPISSNESKEKVQPTANQQTLDNLVRNRNRNSRISTSLRPKAAPTTSYSEFLIHNRSVSESHTKLLDNLQPGSPCTPSSHSSSSLPGVASTSERPEETLKKKKSHTRTRSKSASSILSFLKLKSKEPQQQTIPGTSQYPSTPKPETDSWSDEEPPLPPPILRKAYKRYLIYKAPLILVLNLKRFQQEIGVFGRKTTRKIENNVGFDEYLQIKDFFVQTGVIKCVEKYFENQNFPVSGQESTEEDRSSPNLESPDKLKSKEYLYKLYGIIVHNGSLFGGHYYCYVRIKQRVDEKDVSPGFSESKGRWHTDQWVYFSDTTVRLTSWEEVSKAQAYMLFYERVN